MFAFNKLETNGPVSFYCSVDCEGVSHILKSSEHKCFRNCLPVRNPDHKSGLQPSLLSAARSSSREVTVAPGLPVGRLIVPGASTSHGSGAWAARAGRREPGRSPVGKAAAEQPAVVCLLLLRVSDEGRLFSRHTGVILFMEKLSDNPGIEILIPSFPELCGKRKWPGY